MEKLTLLNVLEAFNAPVNEEQAWAICYQCSKYLQSKWQKTPGDCFKFNEVQAVEIGKDGSIVGINPINGITAEAAESEEDLVQSLGVVVFQALDWGLSETEEHKLSNALEQLIANMTGSDLSDDEGQGHKDQDDEGIEDDSDDEGQFRARSISLEEVIQASANHLPTPKEAASHYKAVCRALINEAQELVEFLERISAEKSKIGSDRDETDKGELELLERNDWARLWMSIMRQLRQGVKLKKVEHAADPNSHEYELTPYEILMEDIRLRRYTLNKVTVEGQIPCRTKKDAHEVILEFIRSRPPLHPVKERTLKAAPPKPCDPREQMLEAIRAEPKLRPTPGRIVETSRTRLDDKDTIDVPTRKVIKPDLSLLMSNSFDDDDDDEDEDDEDLEDRNKVTPSPLEPLTPLSPLASPSNATLGVRTGQPLSWQQQVSVDSESDDDDDVQSDRNVEEIMVRENESRPRVGNVEFLRPLPQSGVAKTGGPVRPVDPVKPVEPPTRFSSEKPSPSPQNDNPKGPNKGRKLQSSLECLSLTIEEVMHIRSVLTKAELECLILDPELKSLLEKGKVCFSCKKTKFSLFGLWSTKCKFCRRSICSKCISKMRIPTDHFEHIPVYTLSPSPMSPSGNDAVLGYSKTGSEPNSPEFPRKVFFGEPPDLLNNNKSQKPRPPLQKSYTLAQPAQSSPMMRPPMEPQHSIQGPLMNICRDCKAMVVNIIRASRTSLAAAPEVLREKFNTITYPSSRPARNFHLDLKPVYKN